MRCDRIILFLTFGLLCPTATLRAADVKLLVTDGQSGATLPCRVHLQDDGGMPVLSDQLPGYHDHFVCSGDATLDLPAGEYSFEIERGPEYTAAVGKFRMTGDDPQTVKVSLKRITNLAADGWWSGELHVHRAVEDIELLMRAEDLHVAPVITWWNQRNLWKAKPLPEKLLVRFDGDRFYHLMGGEDEREGGALLYFNLSKPLPITPAEREYPSPMTFLKMAREHQNVWVDIEKPFWWDVPIWLASEQVDSIGLANNHMCRSRMYEDEAWGKPRDAERLPAPRGNGFWTQELYYKILNTGLRIPPSAGSASGVLPNPIGYNRVYVNVEGELTYEKWWEGLRAGRSFVTNGPLLLVKANGRPPGHQFSDVGGEAIEISLTAEVNGRDKIEAIEVIQNGEVVQSVKPEGTSFSGGLPKLSFNRSGWFLVRVRCQNPRTFRFASTAPFYVEQGKSPRRVSRSASQFFLDWVKERAARVKIEDPQQRREVLSFHEQARRFWELRVYAANVE